MERLQTDPDLKQRTQNLSIGKKTNSFNLPHINKKSRQDIMMKGSTFNTTKDYNDSNYKKQIIERHKIIKTLEQTDNFPRKQSLDRSPYTQSHLTANIGQPTLQSSQSFKALPSLFSPQQQSSQPFNFESQQLPLSNNTLQQKLAAMKRKTSEMRLVFDGLKKIKSSSTMGLGQKEELLPIKIQDNNESLENLSRKSQLFLSTNNFHQMAPEKFKMIFKKMEQNKHIQIRNQAPLETSQDRQQQFEEIKAYLQKTSQIAVVVQEPKTIVQPTLKINLFKLKTCANLNDLSRVEAYQILLGDFIRDVNTLFSKTEKALTLKHLFTKDGTIIDKYEQIQPQDAYIFVSSVANPSSFDERINEKSIMKQIYAMVKSSLGEKKIIVPYSRNIFPSKRYLKKVTKDLVVQQADELIQQQKKNRNKSQEDSMSSTSELPFFKQQKTLKRSLFNSKSMKSLPKRNIQENLNEVSNEAQEEQNHEDLKEFDKIMLQRNRMNMEVLNEVLEMNKDIDEQIQDNAKIQELLAQQSQFESDTGIYIIDSKLTMSSPFAELQNDQKAFNEKMKKLQFELDYKLDILTDKQVQESINEIKDRVEHEMRENLNRIMVERNQKEFQKAMETQRGMQKNRKIQALIHVIQKYLKQREILKKRKSQQIEQDETKSIQIQFPKIQPNRRVLVSKWDTEHKRNNKPNNMLTKSQSFINSVDLNTKNLLSIDTPDSNSIQRFSNSPQNQKTNPFSSSIVTVKKNFIEKNILNNSQLYRNVFNKFGTAFDKNIPTLEQRTGFNRNEIIQIFTRFKALCELTLKELIQDNQDLKTCKGVNFEKFKMGIPELKFETEEFARRVFEQCNSEKKSEYMDWEHFLIAVKAIQSRNIDQKIDLFFKIIDQDGNGSLSYDEVFEICAGSFEKFSSSVEEDEFMRSLTQFFTSVIFRAVGKSLDEEIPLYEIKKAIDKNLADADLLCMFCNAERNLEEKKK